MIELLNPWLGAAFLLAPLHWAARWRGWGRVAAATKPAVMVALILWSLSFDGWKGEMAWFGAGLVLSLLGDVALLLPPRFFPVGLGFFLAAHLCYITGFCLPAPALHFTLIPAAALLALGGYFFFRKLVKALRTRAASKKYIIPSLVYGTALGVMALCAFQTLVRPDWTLEASLLALGGALAFLASDSLLAYNRFVRPLRNARPLEMAAYHVAQICIIAGALLS